VQQLCRSRLQTARRAAQALHRQLRRTGEDKDTEQKKRYQTLVETTEQMVQQATQVVQHLRQATTVAQQLGQRMEAHRLRLVTQAQAVLPLVERVISQTRRRVLEGKKVPSDEKVLSLVEPHTKAIARHKGGQLVEFGRQVVLDEVEGGIITRYEILEHPTEHGQAVTAVAHHVALFDHPPGLVAADRGVHAADTEQRLRQVGVRHVAIPASGKISAERRALEHTRAFRRGYRFRAGIDGRIASLRRDHGLDGMERWLGLGVVASNLNRIARSLG
jgi:IS5 family transposase